jgi:DNA mismatch endonuclease (patch repair protein)
MADTFTTRERSKIMARVRSRNTKPEKIVRQIVFGLGYRYRLHCKDIPGRPDLVFRKKKKAIFVHGCFWHGHDCRAGLNRPTSNKSYWDEKLRKNIARDKANSENLLGQGWKVLVIWECELGNIEKLRENVASFLNE